MRLLLAVFFLSTFALSTIAVADTITFKDGTKKEVRVYRIVKDRVSYVCDGKLEVAGPDKIADVNKDVKLTDKLLTDEELADLLKKSLQKKVAEEEKQNGLKPDAAGVKSAMDPKNLGKGVKIIDKDKSKTHATELVIDPFPDVPVTEKKPDKGDPKKP